MSAMQKLAWFNLSVILLSLCVVLSLLPIVGATRAQAGLGILGLLGLSPILFRRKKGQLVVDERDTLIHRKSVIVGYSVFWLLFVGACCLSGWFYGMDGAVPVLVIMTFPFYAMIVLFAVTSVATLVQYGLGC